MPMHFLSLSLPSFLSTHWSLQLTEGDLVEVYMFRMSCFSPEEQMQISSLQSDVLLLWVPTKKMSENIKSASNSNTRRCSSQDMGHSSSQTKDMNMFYHLLAHSTTSWFNPHTHPLLAHTTHSTTYWATQPPTNLPNTYSATSWQNLHTHPRAAHPTTFLT